MTERNILIIKNSWSYMISLPDKPGVMFYEQLFEVAPQLIPMFKSDLEQQQNKFSDMVTYMVAKLQNMDDIQNEIDALAKRHVHYGAKPEHYQLVGEALISTMRNSLGDIWDEETSQAWTDLYQLWSSSMILAAS
jgi:hemoglobin-like flavoprotein